MIIGPPPKFHGARDILTNSHTPYQRTGLTPRLRTSSQSSSTVSVKYRV